MPARAKVNAEQAPRHTNVDADPAVQRGRPPPSDSRASDARNNASRRVHRGSGDGMPTRRADATRETHPGGGVDHQPDAREGQSGPRWESDGPIVPMKRLTTAEGRGLS